MKIIILAAGIGTRALPLTRNTPKSLLDIGQGVTLLEKQLENIEKSGVVDEVILVVGHLAEQVEAKIKFFKDRKLKISTVYNPFYDSSNNLISLWFASPKMDDDFMITNGDNIFEPDVFEELSTKHNNGIFLTVSNKEKYNEDDMKVILEDCVVSRVSKEIKNEDAHCESVGLALIKGERHRKIFRDHLEGLVRDKRYLSKFWLETFNAMHTSGITIMPFEINGKEKWREVDFHLDLEEARKLLKLDREEN